MEENVTSNWCSCKEEVRKEAGRKKERMRRGKVGRVNGGRERKKGEGQ